MKRMAMWASMGMIGLVAGAADAAVVAEWNFGDENLSSAAPGAGTNGVLIGAATINAGTALGTGFAGSIQNGYLSVPRTTATGNANEKNGLRTDGITAEWNDYIGATHGSASVIMVFRPGANFTAVAANKALFNHKDSPANSSDAVLLLVTSGGDLLLEVGNNRTNPKAYAQLIGTGNTWSTDTWYVIGASWESDADANPNDGAPGNSQPTRAYIRPLAKNGVSQSFLPAKTSSVTSDINSLGTFNGNLVVGMRDRDSINSTVGYGSAAGDFALVQLRNDYLDVAGFDAFYNSLIPEPGSACFAMFGAGLLFARRQGRVRRHG